MSADMENEAFWSRVYERRQDVVTRKIAGETFLIPIRNRIADMQKIFALNPVGEFVWENLDGRSSLSGICSSVLDGFDVARETAMTDLADFIGQLEQAGLIEGKT